LNSSCAPRGCRCRCQSLWWLCRPLTVLSAADRASYVLEILGRRTWQGASAATKNGAIQFFRLGASPSSAARASSFFAAKTASANALLCLLASAPAARRCVEGLLHYALMARHKKKPAKFLKKRKPVNELDPPFVEGTQPPSDLDVPTAPPPRSPSTSPELGYYVCPACHAVDCEKCDTCMGFGIIDRDTMADFKKKENGKQ
jgi:hypothetical protein